MFLIDIYTNDKDLVTFLRSTFLQFSIKFDIKSSFFEFEEDLLQSHLDSNTITPHLLIIDLDIQESFNILRVVKKIRNLSSNQNQELILFSNSIEKLISFIELKPLKLLKKNISLKSFKEEFHNIFKHIIFNINYFIPIKLDSKYLILHTNDILAITKVKEAISQKKLTFHTQKKSYITNGNLSDFINTFNFPFLLIHRSIIINLRFVSQFDSKTVTMSNNLKFPIGRSKIIHFKKFLHW